ncbi:canalicular multispecific organic anion transporter 2 [Chanos chanos]|uniref:Canalicular multispecific organic anion transporter 2 n=1 Tax=Chanos chanos TaxID=29144 RepID=A0A6J2UWG7_CHACN|nr:canalicular multispecific organic anion transporter 2-like [Chanos chanos]
MSVENAATFISRISYWWFNRLLQLANLSKVRVKRSAHSLHSTFEKQWQDQQNHYEKSHRHEGQRSEKDALLFPGPAGPDASLLCSILLTFHPTLLTVTLLRLSSDLLSLMFPIITRWAILFYEGQPVLDWEGYTYALALLGALCCHAVFQQLHERHSKMTVAKAQAALSAALHRKFVPQYGLSENLSPPAAVISLLAEDIRRVSELVSTLPQIPFSPAMAVLYLACLWRELGPAMLVGVTLLLFVIFASSAVQRRVQLLQRTQMEVREESGKLHKEMLREIKMLKFLVWEPWLQLRLTDARERELEVLRILGYLTAFLMLDRICVPFLVSLFSLAVFVLVDDGNVLTVAQVFTSLCLFKLLRPLLADLTAFPSLLTQGSGVALRHYLQAFGWHWVLLLLLVQTGVFMVCVAGDWLLSVWMGEAKEVQGLEEWRELRCSRLSVYAVLGLLQAVLVCCAAFCLTRGSLRASASLHAQLLDNVLHLPLTVFYKTDPTFLLHSLTEDMYTVDEWLPTHLHTWVSCLLEVIGIMLLITFIIPVISLAVCPVTLLFLVMKSKEGQEFYLRRHLKSLQQHLLFHFNGITFDRWAALQSEVVSGIFLLLVTLFLLGSQRSSDSGTVALALVYSLNMRGALHHFTHTCSDLRKDALSIQRISQYAHMGKEAPWTLTHRQTPPPSWPEQGEIEFRQYETEPCTPLAPAFRGLTFCISKGEKVGVVSRNRAETEGLVSCLFRAVEASAGIILIDGLDVASVGPRDLRCHLQLIPQSPVLLSDSLRANLDPLGQYTDAQLWRALELSLLKERVRLLPNQLLHPVQEGGASLSPGQRRQLCLARAMLGRTRVLLVEDSLPSVDTETEHLLQQVIEREFTNCTVLMMSQNPHKVMHTDRVLVLDEGHIVEFDTPTNLLQEGVWFTQLAKDIQTQDCIKQVNK